MSEPQPGEAWEISLTLPFGGTQAMPALVGLDPFGRPTFLTVNAGRPYADPRSVPTDHPHLTKTRRIWPKEERGDEW